MCPKTTDTKRSAASGQALDAGDRTVLNGLHLRTETRGDQAVRQPACWTARFAGLKTPAVPRFPSVSVLTAVYPLEPITPCRRRRTDRVRAHPGTRHSNGSSSVTACGCRRTGRSRPSCTDHRRAFPRGGNMVPMREWLDGWRVYHECKIEGAQPPPLPRRLQFGWFTSCSGQPLPSHASDASLTGSHSANAFEITWATGGAWRRLPRLQGRRSLRGHCFWCSVGD